MFDLRQVTKCLQDLSRSCRMGNLLKLTIAFLLDWTDTTFALQYTMWTTHESAWDPRVSRSKPHPEPFSWASPRVVGRHAASYSCIMQACPPFVLDME